MMKLDQTFFKNLLDSLYDGVYVIDNDRRITFWNKAAERLSGFKASEVVGKFCRDQVLMHVDNRGNSLCNSETCPAARAMMDGKNSESELFLHHKKGHRVPVITRITPIRDGEGKIVGTVEIFNDNSANLSMQEKITELKKLALLDPLTQLGNRRYAETVLNARYDEMKMYGWPFGLLFMDIDHFKEINDRYGHDVGDKILQMVAATLANSLRSVDTVCRWGGEEFIAFIQNLKDVKTLTAITEKCRLLVENSSLSRGDEIIQVQISIGATLSTEEDTLDTLFKRVDRLMYLSKEEGRNRVTIEQA